MNENGGKVQRLLWQVALAVGILIASVSGLCSLAILVSALSPPGQMIGMVALVAVVGGLPFMAGYGLIVLARKKLRGLAQDSGDDIAQF